MGTLSRLSEQEAEVRKVCKGHRNEARFFLVYIIRAEFLLLLTFTKNFSLPLLAGRCCRDAAL